MARLIKDASKLDKSIKANDMSFGNIVKAIHAVQTQMGITGTTAEEAGRTISGSVGAMKSAWTNLITGLADKNADIEKLVGNLVTSIVGDGTENNLGVLGNVMPAVKTALNGAAKLVSELLPAIVEQVPAIINENLPILAQAAISIIKSLVGGISQNQKTLMKTAVDTIAFLAESIITMLPDIVKLGLDLIVSLANGIAENLPELIPTIIDVILQIVETLTNQETLTQLLGAVLTIIKELAWGITNNIDKIIASVFTLLDGIIDFLLKPENLAMLVETAIQLVLAIGVGIIKAIPQLLVSVASLISSVFANFFTADWKSIGTNLVDCFKKGIENAWKNLKQWFENLFGDLIGIAKKILGIASPSKVFKKLGSFTAEGFGVGFENAFGDVERDIENALDFNGTTFGVNAYGSYSGGGALSGIGGTTFGTVNINIEGYNAQDDDQLAEMIAEKLQIMTERRGAVFA